MKFKKIIGFLLVVMLVFGLWGCSGARTEKIDDWITTSVKPTMDEHFVGVEGLKYTVTQTKPGEVTVDMVFEGAAMLSVYAKDDPQSKITWTSLSNSLCDFSNALKIDAANNGINNITININLVNDMNDEKVLLTITDGQATYDCVRDGNE